MNSTIHGATQPLAFEQYLAAVIKEGTSLAQNKSTKIIKHLFGLYSSPGNLSFYLKQQFGNIDFHKKTVLDIGGGYGIFSFYAAYRGAEEVICLEPSDAGSLNSAKQKFDQIQQATNLRQVTFEPMTLQAFAAKNKQFDILLLHNSINHLDEEACMKLLHDENAQKTYLSIFQQLGLLAKPQARLIVCDCSRHNFFAHSKLKNPVASAIEWHKHQAPEVWIQMLTQVGFVHPNVNWTTYRLRYLGQLLFGNRFMSYFLTSHFCLKMVKA